MWNTGDTIQDLTGLDGGTYIVTVTDSDTGSYIDTFTLTEPPTLIVTETITPPSTGTATDGAIDGWKTGYSIYFDYQKSFRYGLHEPSQQIPAPEPAGTGRFMVRSR